MDSLIQNAVLIHNPNAGNGGNGYGGAIYTTVAPASQSGVTFAANSVVAGNAGVDNCYAGIACPGLGGTGGTGGSGGTAGSGGFNGDDTVQALPGLAGVAGTAGSNGLIGINGVGGSQGKANYQNQN